MLAEQVVVKFVYSKKNVVHNRLDQCTNCNVGKPFLNDFLKNNHWWNVKFWHR